MDFNKIEEFLRNGGTADQIAEAFTKQLNDAIAVVGHEKEIENKATLAAEAWNDFINIYFQDHKLPNGTDVFDYYIASTNVVELADTIVRITPFLVKYASVLANLSDGAEELSNKFSSKISENLSDFDFNNVIDAFLGKMNN